MDDKKFCGVGNFSVNVPLEDFLILVEVAKNMASYQKEVRNLNTQVSALRGQYSETLEKIQELKEMI